MKTPAKFASLVIASLSFLVISAQARDTTHFLPIKDAIEMGKAHGLGNDVRFYFASQRHPPVATMLRKGISTNKKTNAANKTDQHACTYVMVTALLQMQQAARDMGGNAVVNIESFYKRKVFRSNDQFECHAGNIVAGVALRGDVVKLRR